MKFEINLKSKLLSVFLIIISGILIPVNSQTVKTWSLQECIQYALDNNIDIQRRVLQTEGRKTDLKHSKLSILPSLSMGVSHSVSIGRSLNYEDYTYVNQTINYGGINAQSSMNLFSGLRSQNMIRRAKLDYLASIEDLEYARDQASLYIAGAYLNILLSMELLNISENQLKVSKQQLERTRVFYEEGQTRKSAFLEIQAQVSNEEYLVTNARNNLKTNILTLTQLLRLPSPEDFEIAVPQNIDLNIMPSLSSVEEIYKFASINLPQIKASVLRMKSRERSLAIARSSISPSISISAGMNSRYSQLLLNSNPTAPGEDYPYIDQVVDNRSQAIGLNMQIPIFNRMQVRNGISNAKISAIDSKLQVDQDKQSLYQLIQQAHSFALAALDSYKSSESAVNSSKQAFDFAEKQYEVGLVNSLDYNLSKNTLTIAESNLIQAKYDYLFRLKILEFYNGKPLSL